MIMVRVINTSNLDITVKNEVIKAKKIRDFVESDLSREDLKTIAAYCASGVAKSYTYEKSDTVTVNNIDEIVEETPTTRKSRKK